MQRAPAYFLWIPHIYYYIIYIYLLIGLLQKKKKKQKKKKNSCSTYHKSDYKLSLCHKSGIKLLNIHAKLSHIPRVCVGCATPWKES